MFAAILLLQMPDSQALMDAFRNRVDHAQSISYTATTWKNGSRTASRGKSCYRKSGYSRLDWPPRLMISDANVAWAVDTKRKTYERIVRKLPKMPFSKLIGFGNFGNGSMRPIGPPKRMSWHGYDSLRVEIDVSVRETTATKLYYFFDFKTHDERGFLAKGRSGTGETLYRDLKFNLKFPDKMFHFSPPKGYKEVKSQWPSQRKHSTIRN